MRKENSHWSKTDILQVAFIGKAEKTNSITRILKLFIEKPVNAIIEIAFNFFGFVKLLTLETRALSKV